MRYEITHDKLEHIRRSSLNCLFHKSIRNVLEWNLAVAANPWIQ
jgi:hypothetical protein